MEKPFLIIKIKTPNPEEGPCVSIRWKEPCPEIFASEDDNEVWDEGDQAWTKVNNAIHALIGELDFNGLTWEIEVDCPDPSAVIQKGLTRQQYHDRHKDDD